MTKTSTRIPSIAILIMLHLFACAPQVIEEEAVDDGYIEQDEWQRPELQGVAANEQLPSMPRGSNSEQIPDPQPGRTIEDPPINLRAVEKPDSQPIGSEDDLTAIEDIPSSCYQALDEAGVAYERTGDPGGRISGCGIDEAIMLGPVVNGITFASSGGAASAILVSCELGRRILMMSVLLKSRNIIEVGHLGTYNCRYMNTGSANTTLSNHAFGDAIDLAWFLDEDGTKSVVLDHYYNSDASGEFLRWLPEEMYQLKLFNTILTPEYNNLHANHFHVDLNGKETFFKKLSLGFAEYHLGSNHYGE